MSVFEVIRGVEGCCLALDDTRIAGPKPWGGGAVIHAWETDEEYKAVDTESRWNKFFGTPERVARTLELLHVEWSDWCAVFSECRDCMFGQVDGERVTCWEPDDFSLVEWLRGDA